MDGWYGVDLDGTLAQYDGWRGPDHIGDPIPSMVARVRRWLEQGREVRIFTARCHVDGRADRTREQVVTAIEVWCERHIGQKLPVTNVKDFGMIQLWDDRCVAIIPNTGVVSRQEDIE